MVGGLVERVGIDAQLDPFDGEPVQGEHVDTNAIDGERVAHLGYPFQTIEHETGDRVVLAIGQVEAGDAFDLVGPGRCGHRPHARLGLDVVARRARVVLVLDVADEFLDDVLECHHAGGTAILVDHDRHLGRPRPKLREHHVETRRLGDGQDVVEQFGHVRRLVVGPLDAQQVLGMDDALHLAVEVDDRKPRVCRGHQIAQVGRGGVDVDRDHPIPGDHRIGRFQFTEVDRPFEERRLALREVSALGGRVDDQVEFLGRHRPSQLLDRLDAHESKQSVRRSVEQSDDRPGETHEQPHRRRERSSDRFGLGDRQVLRGEFAEDHLRHRRQDQCKRDRDPEGDRLGNTDGHQRRLDDRGDGRLGDETDQQGGDRDAELSPRKHETQPFVDVDRTLRTAIAFLGLLQEPASASSDERKLDGHEVPVGCDERNDPEQPESSQHGVNFVFGRRTWVVRCYRPSRRAAATHLPDGVSCIVLVYHRPVRPGRSGRPTT